MGQSENTAGGNEISDVDAVTGLMPGFSSVSREEVSEVRWSKGGRKSSEEFTNSRGWEVSGGC